MIPRFFNTAGPNREEDHYTLPPMARLGMVRQLIDEKRYFIIHAPRQTGKTTAMMTLMHDLNTEGKYIALYVNIESAQAFRNDVEAANEVIISNFRTHIEAFLPESFWPDEKMYQVTPLRDGMTRFLSAWIRQLPRPLVLLIDEIDALIGDSLLSVLRQLRSGYNLRPKGFPHSIALIGLRDVRDYRIFSEATQSYVIGGSAFNIKDESLTVRYFTPEEVGELYAQHTAETGQVFEPEALDLVFHYSQGQPWLVNAIGRTVCFKELAVPRDQPITAAHIRKAVEVLILRRDVHLDQLADKLTEPRVQRIIQAILAGKDEENQADENLNEDYRYLIDLGLIRKGTQGVEIANPVYREVIPRELTWVAQQYFSQEPKWYVKADRKLDFAKVMSAFTEFYREHGKAWLDKRAHYVEVSHQLLLMAWFQRIVNGGGRIEREYAAGRGRIDLMIEFEGERFVVEIKTEENFRRDRALEQATAYAQQMGVDTCLIAVFYTEYQVEKIGTTEHLEHNGIAVEILWL